MLRLLRPLLCCGFGVDDGIRALLQAVLAETGVFSSRCLLSLWLALPGLDGSGVGTIVNQDSDACAQAHRCS